MVSPAGRRKVRKRKSQAENAKMKLGIIIGIMAAAIFLGFLTARFVIGPIIGYNADESPIRQVENKTDDSKTDSSKTNDLKTDDSKTNDSKTDDSKTNDSKTDDSKTNDSKTDDSKTDSLKPDSSKDAEVSVGAAPTEGYALQFGAFSSKDAAQKLAGELKEKGVETEIVEIDKVFKVISPLIDKKSDALSALEEVQEKEVSEVFVKSFE